MHLSDITKKFFDEHEGVMDEERQTHRRLLEQCIELELVLVRKLDFGRPEVSSWKIGAESEQTRKGRYAGK
jgi:hypothetical protein